MAGEIGALAAHRVRVLELEQAGDLGEPGPSITSFGQRLAGPAFANPDWTWGVAPNALTQKYNPRGYLDIYYLLDASGRVVYMNSAPSSTMSQLMAAVDNL
jgi:hypothetical protein